MLKAGLTPLRLLSPRRGHLLAAGQPPKGSNPSPVPGADGVPRAFDFLTHATAKTTGTEYLLYQLGGRCLFASSTLGVTLQPVLRMCNNTLSWQLFILH